MNQPGSTGKREKRPPWQCPVTGAARNKIGGVFRCNPSCACQRDGVHEGISGVTSHSQRRSVSPSVEYTDGLQAVDKFIATNHRPEWPSDGR